MHDWVNQQLYKTVGTIKYIVAQKSSHNIES